MTVVINTTWAEWARAGRRKMCSTWEKVQNSGCKHLDDPVGICRTTSPNPIIWHSLLNVNYKFDLTGHYLRRPNNKYIYGTVRDGRKSHCAVRPGLRSWISQWVLRGGSIQTCVGSVELGHWGEPVSDHWSVHVCAHACCEESWPHTMVMLLMPMQLGQSVRCKLLLNKSGIFHSGLIFRP